MFFCLLCPPVSFCLLSPSVCNVLQFLTVSFCILCPPVSYCLLLCALASCFLLSQPVSCSVLCDSVSTSAPFLTTSSCILLCPAVPCSSVCSVTRLSPLFSLSVVSPFLLLSFPRLSLLSLVSPIFVSSDLYYLLCLFSCLQSLLCLSPPSVFSLLFVFSSPLFLLSLLSPGCLSVSVSSSCGAVLSAVMRPGACGGMCPSLSSVSRISGCCSLMDGDLINSD